eukprot:jgi/Tetstr1/437917/TSEL_026547.t1
MPALLFQHTVYAVLSAGGREPWNYLNGQGTRRCLKGHQEATRDAAGAAGAMPPEEGVPPPVKEKRKRVKRKLPLECRVEGCGADLSELKTENKSDYRVRYKICEEHLKAPEILTQGKMMRFCQQCTSLHELDCFDGAKRSCKNRLNSHNSRRRKKRQPQLDAGSPAGADLAIAPAVNTATLTQLLGGGGGNNAMLSKLYELLNAGSGAPPASAPPPANAALLKSAADVLGSMGTNGVAGAVAALQAVATKPPKAAAPPPAPRQQQQLGGGGGGNLNLEQLTELLGTYNQLMANQQQSQQSQQTASLVSLLAAITGSKPPPPPQPQRPPPTGGLDVAQLTSYLNGLAGCGSGGGGGGLFGNQQLPQQQQQQQQQGPAGGGLGTLAGLLSQLGSPAPAPVPAPTPQPPSGDNLSSLLMQLYQGMGSGGSSPAPAATTLAQQIGALLGGGRGGGS